MNKTISAKIRILHARQYCHLTMLSLSAFFFYSSDCSKSVMLITLPRD
jgi:hypothetical protein